MDINFDVEYEKQDSNLKLGCQIPILNFGGDLTPYIRTFFKSDATLRIMSILTCKTKEDDFFYLLRILSLSQQTGRRLRV